MADLSAEAKNLEREIRELDRASSNIKTALERAEQQRNLKIKEVEGLKKILERKNKEVEQLDRIVQSYGAELQEKERKLTESRGKLEQAKRTLNE